MTCEPCAHCPFKASPASCPRWPTNHTRYCEWVDPNSRAYRPSRVEALARMTPAPKSTTRPSTATIPVAESIRRIANAKTCPARLDPKCGCASLATCAFGFGLNSTVSLAQCIECSNPRLTVAQP